MKEYEAYAARGFGEAHFMIAVMYANAQGVPRDTARAINYDQAVALYEQAGDRGESEALYRAGLLFRDGRGVKQSDVEALSWLLEAAGHGNAKAMRAAARLLETGAAPDPAAARDWFCQAAIADEGKLAALAGQASSSPADERFLVSQLALLERCSAGRNAHRAAALMARLGANVAPALLAKGRDMARGPTTSGALNDAD
jgi:TPR repeat protein